MSGINTLIEYLNNNDVAFRVHSHLPTFSTHNAAIASHTPEKIMAKSRVVLANKRPLMITFHSENHLDEDLLRAALDCESIRLLADNELEGLFPDCEVGAIPPLGNLYDLPVLVDAELASEHEIAFPACTHTESVRMQFGDFKRLVQPMVATFAKLQKLEPKTHGGS